MLSTDLLTSYVAIRYTSDILWSGNRVTAPEHIKFWEKKRHQIQSKLSDIHHQNPRPFDFSFR